MPHIRFNWVDVLFVTLLIRVGYIGFKNGFLPEFFRFLGLFLAFVISFNTYTLLGGFLAYHTDWTSDTLDIIAFLSLFSSILLIFKLLANVASLFFGGGENASFVNRLVGLTIGICRGILIISLLYTLFINSPFHYLAESAEKKSLSSNYIYNLTPSLYSIGIKFYPWEKVETPLVKLLKD